MSRKQISAGTTAKFLKDINDNFVDLYENKQDKLAPSQRRNIYYGSSAPSSAVGEEGDIYVQYTI